ncbi:MAG: hypothetical protein JSS74_14435 [Actinobacteria bacterium]|nr:hypothetical protein [Actinomycetota bacterium]
MSMAQNTPSRADLLEPEFEQPRRSEHLHAVDRPARRRPKKAYAITALAGALLIGAAQIALTIATTQDSYVADKLSQQNRELTWRAQAAAQELDGVSSPQALASAAAKLGLVVGGSASYLRLSDGGVIGAAGSAPFVSTVNPTGANGVPNALVHDTPPATAAGAAGTGVQPKAADAATADTNVPPTAEGLPTPTIR